MEFDTETEETTGVKQRRQDSLLYVASKIDDKQFLSHTGETGFEFATNREFAVELANAYIDAVARTGADSEVKIHMHDERRARSSPGSDGNVKLKRQPGQAREFRKRIRQFRERTREYKVRIGQRGESTGKGRILAGDGENAAQRRGKVEVQVRWSDSYIERGRRTRIDRPRLGVGNPIAQYGRRAEGTDRGAST